MDRIIAIQRDKDYNFYISSHCCVNFPLNEWSIKQIKAYKKYLKQQLKVTDEAIKMR